jgi:hypothetical protein
MTAEIIDFSSFREKNHNVDMSEMSEPNPIMKDLIRTLIEILMENGYDPYDDLTAERMSILVTMFQSHLNYIDSGEEGIDLFGIIKEIIFIEDEEEHNDE